MELLLVSIILVLIFATIFVIYIKHKHKQSNIISSSEDSSDPLERKNLFSKGGIKIMSYEEALEASKQFIYDITRLVMQKFTPDAKQELSDIGRQMLQAGMEYFHVVDIFSLSLQKQQRSISKKKDITSSKRV